MNELAQLKKEVEDLKAWKRSLEASHSIPLAIHQAFTGRFGDTIADLVLLPSSVNPNTKEQTTSAGGGDVVPQRFSKFKVDRDGDLIPAYTP